MLDGGITNEEDAPPPMFHSYQLPLAYFRAYAPQKRSTFSPPGGDAIKFIFPPPLPSLPLSIAGPGEISKPSILKPCSYRILRKKGQKKKKKRGRTRAPSFQSFPFSFSSLTSSLGTSPLCMGAVGDVVVAGGGVVVIEKEKNGKGGVFICAGTADGEWLRSEHRALVAAIG